MSERTQPQPGSVYQYTYQSSMVSTSVQAQSKHWETFTDFHNQLSNSFGKVFKWFAAYSAERNSATQRLMLFSWLTEDWVQNPV